MILPNVAAAVDGTGSAGMRRAVRYGKLPLLALAATTALETGERGSLAQAVDGLQTHFHLSEFQVGMIPTAMFLIGVVGAFPFGILADRVRRTYLLAAGVAIWTLCMGLGAIATSFAFLFVSRLGVGMVEANGPAAVSLLADYYPVKDRAKKMGLYQLGAFFGGIAGFVGGGVAVKYGGWRWAFIMWIPFGIAVILLLLAQPEPRRGDQDDEFSDDLGVLPELAAGETLARLTLPEPPRVGTLDYATASSRDVFRELLKIRSMWFGVFSLTVGQLLLSALQFWSVEYFKKVHHLDAAQAGGIMGLLAMGSVAGILGGGFISDRYLRRGVLNARVYVVVVGSILGTATLMPAFASTSLAVTAPLFFFGGLFLTLPLAPSEALVTDVCVAQLRGRAATVRSVVRALSAFGPLIVGGLATAFGGGADGLRLALVWLCPAYAVGGVVMLFAAKHYPGDIAFVAAESRRCRPETDTPDEIDRTTLET